MTHQSFQEQGLKVAYFVFVHIPLAEPVTWALPTVREAGMCSLPINTGRRNRIYDHLITLCHSLPNLHFTLPCMYRTLLLPRGEKPVFSSHCLQLKNSASPGNHSPQSRLLSPVTYKPKDKFSVPSFIHILDLNDEAETR